jgi:KDO2-lipid IV(A) lauroyltransferase
MARGLPTTSGRGGALSAFRHLPGAADLFVAVAEGVVRVLAALPGRWIPPLADALGVLLYHLDARGRAAGLANLEAVFGEEMPPARRRAVLRASYRNAVRSLVLLLHLQPLRASSYRRWVEVPPNLERRPELARLLAEGGVLASGHFGNWELLLGLRILFPHLPRTVFLAETLPHPALDRFLQRLRAHGDLEGARRKGGARTVARTVQERGIAALLIDRNVRRDQGGVYMPFLGLEARTTPVPGWAYARYGGAVHPILCLPGEGVRYRIWVGPDLTRGVPREPADACVREVGRRLHAVLEAVIRAAPEHYHWMLKRFKSRPTESLGRHPPYSRYEPEGPRPGASAADGEEPPVGRP